MRLAALKATRLLDSPPEEEFDRITRLAARMVGAPVCLVSLVDDTRQFFKSSTGLPAGICETPLSHSFCQHAVTSRQRLKIEDARTDPRVADNEAVRDFGVAAYLGFPLEGEDGSVWGSFCVLDTKPRSWTAEEESTVGEFAAIVANLIEQRRAANRLFNLIEVLAHDLKNPLSGVRMIGGLLNEKLGELPPGCHPLVNSLNADTTRALELMANVVGRARRSVDPEPPRPTPVYLWECFAEAGDRFHTALTQKNILLFTEIHPPDAVVEIDRWALTHILDNLVSNAIKFSAPESAIALHAIASPSRITIEVHDQGPGFTEEDLTRLYQRYARLSAKPTDGEDSTGLGLSLVKRLVDQANGQIECLSKPGVGTTFRLAFPAP
ncbi:MAG: GAF domain-containing sensor histidine kinase [Luteolibacter sp.]